jgi:glutamate dehydrogenase
MSDTTEAAVERLRSNLKEFSAINRELERLVGPEESALVQRFAELFFSKAPPSFLAERSPLLLARMVLENFRFLQRSRADRVDVEVINPDVDNEGWFLPVTVIRTNVSERPFVVDSIREFLHAEGLTIETYIYPVIQVIRDAEGEIERVAPSREGGTRESLVHCEISRVSDPDRLHHLQDEIRRRLEDVVRVTDDFGAMRTSLDETVAELEAVRGAFPDRADEVEEAQAFLGWLRDAGFVFLGYRAYRVDEHEGEPVGRVELGSGLGVLRDEGASSFASPRPIAHLPERQRKALETGPLLIISKTNSISTVHRRARMDYIGVKRLDAGGRVIGERRFIGLFTSGAYSEKADRIPILRKKLDRILEDSGVAEGSHDYKEIHTIFNSLPKEELFLTSSEEIGDDIRTVLTTFDSEEVRVSLRRDPLQRGASIMVILAKERFSGDVRKRIEEAFIEVLDGEVLNYHLALGEGDQARLHFYMAVPLERLESVTSAQLEGVVRHLTRRWSDHLLDALESLHSAEEAIRLAALYGGAFPADYQAANSPDVAATDMGILEGMRARGPEGAAGQGLAIHFRNPAEVPGVAEGAAITELRLYLAGERLILSEFMPILENCGLRVIAVTPFEIGLDGERSFFLYTFLVQGPDGNPVDIQVSGRNLADAILAVRQGEATNCRLNALVLSAGLTWREVEVLRAYASYAFQARAVPSRAAVPATLRRYPELAALLLALFRVRHAPQAVARATAATATATTTHAAGAPHTAPQPDTPEAREQAQQEVMAKLTAALAKVDTLAEDRAIRAMMRVVLATLRTNYFRHGGGEPTKRSGGVPYISFKFDARGVDPTGASRLRYEVWVRSPRMEGVHLRGAKVARGGIRWSDRPDDFRTEVMGLVKTQMVKNAVIVPAGSKGGFVTLRRLAPEAMGTEAEEQYKTLIRGLLDLTDNLVDGETRPPEGVFCWDEPDPYLVVAADKGTAKFSDVANGVAAEYGFWLGDAFASGGSVGYDHKQVGITARGAWECVKRHFLEAGKDIQTEPFTVVGIGDMSGDVFGNGMLLSRQIRLVAAFDHRHIFLDPDPDPEVSWQERKRIFDLGRSSWEDYNPALLSPGGMIVSRGSRTIVLSERMREVLGIAANATDATHHGGAHATEGSEAAAAMDGETLIRHILQAPVELLWNGGIGTYVKASHETHALAGDPANDAVRVDARALRCEVVGEGGNLGFTQEARIEFALSGGRINTDAIDNSGGVDLSDREVNLKILLQGPLNRGELEPAARNQLLRDLEDEVAALVLRDNEDQGMAVSLEFERAQESMDDFRDLTAGLERAGVLDRAAEHLPTWEVLEERRSRGLGFTRPELSVLLAYAKLHLTGSLLLSDVPDDPIVDGYVQRYFPAKAVELVGESGLREHRLRREIVASQVAGDLVNLMGAGFVHRVSEGMGVGPAEVARAWLVATRFTGHATITESLRMGRTEMPVAKVYRWLRGLARVLDRTTRSLLADPDFTARSTADILDLYQGGLGRLRDAFPDLVAGSDRVRFLELVAALEEDGVTRSVSKRIVALRFLDQMLEILRAHHNTGVDPVEVAQAFYQVSEDFRIPWFRDALGRTTGDDRWENRAVLALMGDVNRAQERLVSAVLRHRGAVGSVSEAVQRLLEEGGEGLERYRALADEVEAEEVITLPALVVVGRALQTLARRLAEAG